MRITPSTSEASLEHTIIGARWSIDRFGKLTLGWPVVGEEHLCSAIGWVAAEEPIGVIEATDLIATRPILDALEARFPGRRWFEGRWGATTEEIRRAA